jgi:hypothetical protein
VLTSSHREGYELWKENHYGTGEPNSRTGQVLSKKSLHGRTKIEEKEITLVYGTNRPPDGAAFGNPESNCSRRTRR